MRCSERFQTTKKILAIIQHRNQSFLLILVSRIHTSTLDDKSRWHPDQTEIKSVIKRASEVCKAEGMDVAAIALQYALKYGDRAD
mmetsp:Transcript_4161/g.7618  ORF Transcript_4161/g.7618 Transcript_4161/m.7618 type:complete len:85 (-) Transcript_4161:43-297(-)